MGGRDGQEAPQVGEAGDGGPVAHAAKVQAAKAPLTGQGVNVDIGLAGVPQLRRWAADLAKLSSRAVEQRVAD